MSAVVLFIKINILLSLQLPSSTAAHLPPLQQDPTYKRLAQLLLMTRLALQSPGFRRRQMLTIVAHTVLIPICLSTFFIMCAWPALWPAIGLYLVFIFIDPRAESGANLSPLQEWFRSSRWWKWFSGYYPVVVHKTAELKPCFEVTSEAAGNPSNASTSISLGASTGTSNRTTNESKITESSQLEAAPKGNWIARFVRFVWAMARWWFYTITGQSALYAKPTGQKYIFGYHPHGIIGMGVVGGLATDGAHWNQLFPGVPVRLLTIANNFRLPLYREYLLGAGIASVSRHSCLKMLENGNPICIVVGGARESLLSEPGKMDLILAKRFGFVKIALQTGASLVPTIGFGETDLYRQARLDDGFGANMHTYMTRNFGYTIPLFHARGIFNYDKGIIPYRRPIHVVVGKPIDVPKIENVDYDTIQKYHDIYVRALKDLYAEYKPKYWPEGGELVLTDE